MPPDTVPPGTVPRPDAVPSDTVPPDTARRDTGSEQREALLAADARAASQARALVRGALPSVHSEVLDTLLLLTSELVGNAVRHGAGPVRLHIESRPPGMPFRVRVGVGDQDPRPPRRRGPTPDAQGPRGISDDFPPESGRGVLLLDALASRWGVENDPPGKQVWFELDLPS